MRQRDAGQAAEAERADAQARKPETGRCSTGHSCSTEETRATVVVGDEDRPLGQWWRQRSWDRYLALDSRHRAVLRPNDARSPTSRRAESCGFAELLHAHPGPAAAMPRLAACWPPRS